MATIIAYVQFTAAKVGVNGLPVTWDVERITRADGTRSALGTAVAGQAVGRRGLYYYMQTGADLTLYDYVFTAVTPTTSVDLQEVPALWTLWSLSWHDVATSTLNVAGSIGKLLVDNINATISSRSSHSAADIWAVGTRTLTGFGTLAADVWAVATRTITGNSDKTGYSLSSAGVQAIWDALTTALTTAGSIGKRIADNLDAAVSATETADHSAMVFSEMIAGFDSVEGVVAAAFTAYDPPTKAELDAAQSVIISALPPSPPSPSDIAAEVESVLADDFAAVGDPLLSSVPGGYASGTAGHALGRIVGAEITAISHVARNGRVDVVAGYDYLAADGYALEWNEQAHWPDLTGATVSLEIIVKDGDDLSLGGSVAGGKVLVDVSAEQTTTLGTNPSAQGYRTHGYRLQAVLATGNTVLLERGSFMVEGQ